MNYRHSSCEPLLDINLSPIFTHVFHLKSSFLCTVAFRSETKIFYSFLSNEKWCESNKKFVSFLGIFYELKFVFFVSIIVLLMMDILMRSHDNGICVREKVFPLMFMAWKNFFDWVRVLDWKFTLSFFFTFVKFLCRFYFIFWFLWNLFSFYFLLIIFWFFLIIFWSFSRF